MAGASSGRGPNREVSIERQFPDVLQALRGVTRTPRRIVRGNYTWQNNTTGELSEVASYRFPRPAAVRTDVPPRIAIVAYESFTTDGTADNQEEFSLSQEIINNPNATQPFLLYEGGSVVSADAVDYDNNHFDYTDDGTNNTLHAYYLVEDAAGVVIRKAAPGGQPYEDLMETNTVVTNPRDQFETPLSFDMGRSPLQPVLGKDWELQVHVDASYTVQHADGSDTGAVATNMLVQVPVFQSQERVPGLAKALKHDIQNRA